MYFILHLTCILDSNNYASKCKQLYKQTVLSERNSTVNGLKPKDDRNVTSPSRSRVNTYVAFQFAILKVRAQVLREYNWGFGRWSEGDWNGRAVGSINTRKTRPPHAPSCGTSLLRMTDGPEYVNAEAGTKDRDQIAFSALQWRVITIVRTFTDLFAIPFPPSRRFERREVLPL